MNLLAKKFSIDRDMLVGRHQSADLVLQSAEISRKHAAFLLKEQALYVQDLNSSNGSFVNDLRIADETLLKEGDIVQFASLKFSVLAPAVELEHAADVAETADKVTAQTEKTPAQQMNEQGMPELNQRDSSVQLNRDGMPKVWQCQNQRLFQKV